MGYQVETIHALERDFHFVLNSEVDHIQNVIRAGSFYELEELNLVAELAGNPKAILDVGANIGNHTLYFAHCFNPDVTIPIEPNPLVTPMLRANLALNWHPSFDLSLVGFGFSDKPGRGVAHTPSKANLGGSKLEMDERGVIPVVTADDTLPGRHFDLIKIDVEGMENMVIAGMADILRRSNALVFVEVIFKNIDTTISQLRALGYTYVTSYQRYGRCINLIFEKL